MKKDAATILAQVDLLHVLDAIPHGIAVLDNKLRVFGLNRFLEALTGYTRAEAQGVFGEYILRSNLSQQGNPLRSVLETGETAAVEGDIINRNRKKIPIRFTVSALTGHDREIKGVIITLEDISLLKDLGGKVYGVAGLDRIIGNSPKMQEIFELLPVIARTDASALITGETGTGKDLVAEAIHQASKRARAPFIKVNCGALPESLLESELFGHMRGAFTGAQKDKPGMFRLAHGGTIYLTEIGDLPLPLQVKLLTVLDDREFFPLGSSKKVSVDVRVIAGTHRDLRELVQQRKFREDLFYRLNVLRLHLPSLREREGDIRLLLDHFVKIFNANLNKNIKGFSKKTLDVLLSYSYPGNVRELRNIVEYAVNICPDDRIEPLHLPKYTLSGGRHAPQEEGREQEKDKDVTSFAEIFKSRQGSAPTNSGGWTEMEKKMIMEALLRTGGRRSQAAKILGWGRSTLWRKLKQYDLE